MSDTQALQAATLPSHRSQSIVRLDQSQRAGAIDHPRPDRQEQGKPRRESWTLHESADLQMAAGIWACEVCRWRIAFPPGKHEYFCCDAEHAFEVLSTVRKHCLVVGQAASQ